jgi:hypothetical protein
MTRSAAYGREHKIARQRLQDQLDRGALFQWSCTRIDCPHHNGGQCPVLIDGWSSWDLGHLDDGSGGSSGPECPPCNRSAGASAMLAKMYPGRFWRPVITAPDRW